MDSHGQPFNSRTFSSANLTGQSNNLSTPTSDNLGMSTDDPFPAYFENTNPYGAPPNPPPNLEPQPYATPFIQDYIQGVYNDWNDSQALSQRPMTHRRGPSASSSSSAHWETSGRGRGVVTVRGRGALRGNNLASAGRGVLSRESSAAPQQVTASSPTLGAVFRTSPSPYMQGIQLPAQQGLSTRLYPIPNNSQFSPRPQTTLMNSGSYEKAPSPQHEAKALSPSYSHLSAGGTFALDQRGLAGDSVLPVGTNGLKTRSPLASTPELPKTIRPTPSANLSAGGTSASDQRGLVGDSVLPVGTNELQMRSPLASTPELPKTVGPAPSANNQAGVPLAMSGLAEIHRRMAVDESNSEDSSSSEGDENPSVDVDKARYPRGPRSAKSRDRINEVLTQLIETGKRTAAEEKLPPEHIWSRLTTEVTVTKANSFNLFEKVAALELSAKRSTFFETNPGATEDDPRCPRPKPKEQILSEYTDYKKRAGDNLHQRLQNKIAKLQDQETQGMRFRQRQNAFEKTWGNVTEQLNHVSAIYGFESVILFGGNLAVDLFPDMCKIYETPGAKAFVTEKVGDPLTVLQSHFRSHVLNVHTETQVALKRMPSHADLEGVEWPLRLTGLDTSKPWSQPTLETTEASITEYTESTPLDVLKQAVYTLMESMQQSFVTAAPPEVEKVLRGNTGSGVTYHAWLSWLTVLAASWGQYNVEYVLVNWPLSVRPPSRPEEIRLSQMSSKEYLSLLHAFKAGKGPVVRLRRPEDDSDGIVFGQNMEVLVTRDGKRTVTSQEATVLSGGSKGSKTSPATRQTRSHSSNTPSALPENGPGATKPGGAPSTAEKIEAPLVPRLPKVAPAPKKKAAKAPAAGGKAKKSATRTGGAKKAKPAGRKGKPTAAVEEDVEMDAADGEQRAEDTDELVEEEERYDYRALEAEGLAVVAEPNPPSARVKRGADVSTNAAGTSASLPAKRVKIEQEQAGRKTPSTPPAPVFNLQEPTPSAPRTIAQFPPPSVINPQLLAIPQPLPPAASPPTPSLEQESSADCSQYTWEPECGGFLRNDLDGEEMRSIWTDPAHYRLAIGYGWVPFDLEGFGSEEDWVTFEFE